MLYSTSVATFLGTFQVFCDDLGLTEIILPNANYIAPEGRLAKTKGTPLFLELAAKQIIEYCKGRRTIFDLP